MSFSQDSTDIASVTSLGHGKHPSKLQLLRPIQIQTQTHTEKQLGHVSHTHTHKHTVKCLLHIAKV